MSESQELGLQPPQINKRLFLAINSKSSVNAFIFYSHTLCFYCGAGVCNICMSDLLDADILRAQRQ